MAVFDTGSNASVPAGGPVDFSNMSYQDLYNYITAKASGDNGFGGYQVAPEYQGGIAYNNQGWQQGGQSSLFQNEPSTREANDTERMFARLGQVGETLADPLGFGQARQDYGAFDPRTWGAFIPSLPGGIASAPFSAASKGYEAATGTNVESLDWDKGTISNEKLDSNQRAAVGADAAIDLVGTAMGGSGRLLSAGINAGRMAAGRGAEQIGKGYIARMGGKAGGQLAFDIAEEGGEEFVQSYLGDIRHEQLDEGSFGRALEGAAWGAAGGALMSGGGIALNKAMYGPDAYKADENEYDAAQTAASPIPGTDSEWERELNETDVTGMFVPSAAQQFADDLPKTREIASSASTVNAHISDDLDLMHADLGEQVLRSIWESNIEDSQQRLAKAFADATGDNVESMMAQINNINKLERVEDRVKGWNDILDRATKEVRFVAGRNPDTNATGAAYVNLNRVHEGDSIGLNRLGFMMFGADVDGDKTQVYFGEPEIKIQGYLTRNLVSAVTGKSNLNKDYMSFLKDSKSDQRFREKVNKAIRGQYGLKGFKDTEGNFVRISDIKKMFGDSITAGDGGEGVARALDNLRAYIFKANVTRQYNVARAQGNMNFKNEDVDWGAANNAADATIARIMYELEQESSALPEAFEDAVRQIEAQNDIVNDDLVKLYDGFGAKFTRPGDTAGATHFAQFALDLGFKIAANTDLGNPFFRQGGQTYHMSKAIQNTAYLDFSKVSQGDMVNVFTKIMAFSYKLRDVGTDVENSIEGVFRLAIQDKVRSRFAGKKISDQESFDEFMDIFTEEYNQAVDDYEEAWKSPTTQGLREMFNAPHKKKLGDSKAERARIFMDVFGKFNVDTFVSISDSNLMNGRTFEQVVEENATYPGRWLGQFENMPGMDKFWESLMKDYGGKRHAVGLRIESHVDNACQLINDMKMNNYLIESNGKVTINPKGMAMMTQVVDAFNLLLGPKSTLKLNLASVESFVNTRWGKAMISGDRDKVLNAFISVWLTDQYTTAIDIMTTKDLKNDPAWRNNLICDLMSKANNSVLHMMIFKSFVEQGENGYQLKEGDTTNLLKMMTSLDVSIQTKMKMYDNVQVNNLGKGSLIADACSTDSDSVAMSAIGQRLTRASRAMDRAEKLSFEKCKQQIDKVTRLIHEQPGNLSLVVKAIKNLCSQAYVSTSTDMIASAVYSQLDLVKDMVEKGTSTNTSTSVFQSMSEINKGAIMSWLDEVGVAAGNMTINNFIINRRQLLSLLTDPEAYVRIIDPTQDGVLELTQYEFFKSYGVTLKDKNKGPEDDEFWRVFQQIPQLASIVAPQSLDVITDGSSTTLSSNVAKKFDNAIDEMVRGGLKDDAIRERKELENQAKQMMMNDPDWWSTFVGACDTRIASGEFTLEQTKKACEKTMNEFVDYMMTFASMDDGQTYKEEMSVLYNSAMNDVLNHVDRTFTNMAAVSERVRMGDSISNLDIADITNSTIDDFLTEYLIAQGMIYNTFFDGEIDFDLSKAVRGVVNVDVDVLKTKVDLIREHASDYANLFNASINMFDSRDFSISSSMLTPTGNQIRKNLIENARQKAAGNQKMLDAIDKIEQDYDSIQSDPSLLLRKYGIDNNSIMQNATAGEILDETFYVMDPKDAVEACRKIQVKYGIEESWSGKAEEKITKAFSNPGITDDKVKIKRFYNNLIVSRSMKNIIQGSAININTEYVMQTIDAQQKTIDLAKKFKAEIAKDKLYYTGQKALRMPTFHFDNPATSYMSASIMMNMQSSSVATGISMDGSMTKLMGAIGALPANKFAYTSKSQSNRKINGIARVVEELVNYFQEPIHLKFKKSTAPGMVAVIAGGIDAHPELREVSAFVKNPNEQPAATAVRLIDEQRVKIAQFYKDQLDAVDSGNKLGFGPEELDLLAEFTTPYIEVIMNDGSKQIVSMDKYLDSTTWDTLDSAGISSVRAVVCSLSEISAKIIRGIARNYYDPSIDPDDITVSKINAWAEAAYDDWSAYTNTNAFTVQDVMDRVIARGDSFPSAIPADLALSAIQRWDDAHVGSIRSQFTSKLDPTILINENYLNNVITQNKTIRSQGDYSSLAQKYVIVKADSGRNVQESVFKDNSAFLSVMQALNGNDNQLGNTRLINRSSTSDPTPADVTEIYYGLNTEEASRAINDAFDRNHCIAIPADILNKGRINGVLPSVLLDAKSHVEKLNGVNFIILDPLSGMSSSYHSHIPQGWQTPLDRERITTAIGDEKYLNLPDGAHFKNPLYDVAFGYYGDQSLIMRNLTGGYSLIVHPETWKEISSLDVNEDIDFTYYVDKARHGNQRSFDSYKAAVEQFINQAKGKTGKIPRTLSDVKHGDCIGFVKQITDMNETVYVPVFYEGNVPETAETVTVDVSNGEMRIVYSSNSVNYGRGNTQKLNLFGVEFKSMGRDAREIAKKWIAIDHKGYENLFGKHGGPEYIFDFNALNGRVFDMDDNIVSNNLFYLTRKIGGNLFYTLDSGRNNYVRKGNLNKGLTDSILADLTTGNKVRWKEVASGKIKIFDENINHNNVRLNETIAKISNEILLRGCDPVRFFCPTHITHHSDGSYEFKGLAPYDMPINMFTRNFTRDQVLSLFNAINRDACPPSTLVRDDAYILDRHGRMLATNVDSKPVRVYALIGPHYYTGEGTATGEHSRGATMSFQHMIKSLLRMGVYEPGFADLMKYMDMQVGDYRISKTTAEERLDKINFEERYSTRPRLNKNIAERVDEAVNDPLILETMTRYRRARSEQLENERHPLRITLGDQKTLVTEDKDALDRCEKMVSKLNDALVFDDPRDKLTLSEVAYITKFAIGYSDNDGKGFTSITDRQFTNAVQHMIDSVKERGLLIKPESYSGGKGDQRVRFCLLPPGLSQRIFTAKAIYSHPLHVDDKGNPSFSKFVEDQVKGMRDVIDPALGRIDNQAKKTALRHMADALYYANGQKIGSGYVMGDVYFDDVMQAMIDFGAAIGLSDNARSSYEVHCRINKEKLDAIQEAKDRYKRMPVETDVTGRTVLWRGDDATIGAAVLRNLAETRKAIGMTYLMLRPANIIERTLTQGEMSIAMKLGQTGLPLYKFSYKTKDPNLTRKVAHDEGVIEFWAAMRTAELYGVEEELLSTVRNATDIRNAISNFMQERSLMERWQNKMMDFASGGRRGISMQIQLFLDRVVQRAPNDAPWLIEAQTDGMSFLEQRLSADPIGAIVELFNGDGRGNNPTYFFARECRNWAYKGDMAQKNLLSAIYAEMAKRSAGLDFVTTAFVSPYFQYATNRLMRITNFVAPISSLHYLLVEAAQGDGIIGNLPVPGLKDVKINELNLAGVQVHQNLKEAMTIDIMHMGVGTVALMLLGMAGAIEPPEDKDKWGNFKEWSYFGFRGDIPWWLEDCMGLVMPLVAFGKSCQLGEPRVDLIMNGLQYYLNNNPAVKVADAVQVLFDPFSELYRDYDNDVEGYAKAMGGPPSFTDMVNGKATSFGLSLVSQFITPGFVREIYNEGQRNGFEKSYKKVYEQDETGRLSRGGQDDNDTAYTTYADAMIRKYTRNNPVMGLLADLVLKGDGDTGYLASEMPNVVYYDPAQMNSIEAFSLYNDPYTKESLKSKEECDAIALQVVGILQGHNVDDLRNIGFMLDYDTRAYVSQYIWDQIATLNEQWYTLEQSGGLDYYVAGDGDYTLGQQLVSQLKEDHYAQISYWKNLYSEKLWADELTNMTAYNRVATSYAQDANGEWYAVGYRRSGFLPVTFAPSETPGDGYKYVGPHEADWQTESAVTGAWTGQRGLVPIDMGQIEPLDKPSIESWSTDGTDTGHSNIWNGNNNSSSSNITNGTNGTGSKGGSRGGYGYSRSGGGGGRRGGGGGGGGSTPNIYSRVSTPNIAGAKTMNTNRNQNADYDYLRPSFQTKGSREAYRREDI